jgi:hypothetical protein
MSVLLAVTTKTEGRRGSQTRLLEGGRYLGTPQNRSCATVTDRRRLHQEADGALLTPPARAHDDQPKPSPFSVSHFRGALQSLTARTGRMRHFYFLSSTAQANSQVTRSETRPLCDAGQHARTNLLVVVERKDEIGPTLSR